MAEPEDQSTKRMRLGTRSCAECRRRKVRCVFTPGMAECDACFLHHVQCRPQRPSQTPPASESSQEAYSPKRTAEQLATLDSQVRRIYNVIGLDLGDSDSSPGELERRAPGAYSPSPSAQDSQGLDETSEAHRDAPLPSLLREAKIIEDQDEHRPAPSPPKPNRHIRDCMASLANSLPPEPYMTNILELSKKYWLIWPLHTSMVKPEPMYSYDAVAAAKIYVKSTMASKNPAVVAKTALWLSLCLQQCHADFAAHPKPPGPSFETLFRSYLESAEALVTYDAETRPTLQGVECALLQYRVYINMGRVRKAWFSIRRGISSALLIGIARSSRTTDQQKKVWSALWQTDRHLSILLGMPYAIVESHASLSEDCVEHVGLQRAERDLSIIIGHIIDRSQDHKTSTYVRTIEIDQELEAWYKTFLSNTTELSTQWMSRPLVEVWKYQTLVMHYHAAMKILHTPYFLKSSTDDKFSYSRQQTLRACRAAINCYRSLHHYASKEIPVCDLLDFQAFSAAIPLIIDLMVRRCDEHLSVESDWQLVEGLASDLELVNQVHKCAIAGQSAAFLKLLRDAGHGQFVLTGSDALDVVVPYFGKVRINSAFSSTRAAGPWPAYANAVQFDASIFGHFDPRASFFSGDELAVDWTFDTDLQEDWDWNLST